jgi:hypothetical protein
MIQTKRGHPPSGFQTIQCGQAIAELTVAISVILVLLAGLLDVAPALVHAGEVSQAVREGVDYGHMNPSDTAGIRTRVRNASPMLTLADSDITVTCFNTTSAAVRACNTVSMGDTIEVSVATSYVPRLGFLATLVGGSIGLSRSATSLIY